VSRIGFIPSAVQLTNWWTASTGSGSVDDCGDGARSAGAGSEASPVLTCCKRQLWVLVLSDAADPRSAVTVAMAIAMAMATQQLSALASVLTTAVALEKWHVPAKNDARNTGTRWTALGVIKLTAQCHKP
jgi:hypothetical protein